MVEGKHEYETSFVDDQRGLQQRIEILWAQAAQLTVKLSLGSED